MTSVVACVSFVAETCLSSRCLATDHVIMSQYSFLFGIVLQIMLFEKFIDLSQFPRLFYCPKRIISQSTSWNAFWLTAMLFWCNDIDTLTSSAFAVRTFIPHTSCFLKLPHKLVNNISVGSNMNRNILCTARKTRQKKTYERSYATPTILILRFALPTAERKISLCKTGKDGHGNKTSGSIKCSEFLSSCANYGFSRRAQLHVVSLVYFSLVSENR
jgi:hypothetical protein